MLEPGARDHCVGVLEAAAGLPRHHGDPFDRVLVAHALQDELRVLTRDRSFAGDGVNSRLEAAVS